MADLDGKELTPQTDLVMTFSRSYLEDRDPSAFSIDFSPYGKEDTSEIGTSNRVAFPAEYGQAYTIVFSGDTESGFKAELAPGNGDS